MRPCYIRSVPLMLPKPDNSRQFMACRSIFLKVPSSQYITLYRSQSFVSCLCKPSVQRLERVFASCMVVVRMISTRRYYVISVLGSHEQLWVSTSMEEMVSSFHFINDKALSTWSRSGPGMTQAASTTSRCAPAAQT